MSSCTCPSAILQFVVLRAFHGVYQCQTGIYTEGIRERNTKQIVFSQHFRISFLQAPLLLAFLNVAP